MRTNRTLNVRCCCTPRVILGTLTFPASDDELVPEVRIPFTFMPRAFSSADPCAWESGPLSTPPVHEVRVTLRQFNDYANGTRELAVYSDDHPLEFWRQLPGFVEGARA